MTDDKHMIVETLEDCVMVHINTAEKTAWLTICIDDQQIAATLNWRDMPHILKHLIRRH